MKYTVILEEAERGWGAYVPDLPGCVAHGDDVEDATRLIRDGIAFHLEGLREAGQPVPQPTSIAIEVDAA